MSIKRIFVAISAIFAVSAVFADNSSVTSKKYVDDLMSGYQGKLPGSGANTLMIYDDETGIGEKSIEATLVENATGVPTVSAVKTGLDGKQDTITGTAGYVMTGTGTPGEVGEKPIYSSTIRDEDSLVTAESVNTGVINAVNSSLRRVNANGDPDNNGTLWEIADTVLALSFLPAGYTQLEYIESTGTQYIDTGIVPSGDIKWVLDNKFTGISTYGQAGSYNGEYDGAQPILRLDIALVNSGLYLDYGAVNMVTSDTQQILNHRMIFIVDAKNMTWSYGNSTGAIPAYTDTRTVRTKPLYLFARNDHSGVDRKSLQKTYSSKIYKNDVLVQNLVPAKRDSDSKIGMYDTVSGTFFPDAAGGNFIAGPPVGN